MDAYGVSGAEGSAAQDSDEDPLSGHDTITRLMVNGAAVMAFLADLRNFSLNVIANAHASADGETDEVNAFSGNVLGKVTGTYGKAYVHHLLNALYGQEADLPMPFAGGMGVTLNAVVVQYGYFRNGLLAHALAITYVNGNYLCAHVLKITYSEIPEPYPGSLHSGQ